MEPKQPKILMLRHRVWALIDRGALLCPIWALKCPYSWCRQRSRRLSAGLRRSSALFSGSSFGVLNKFLMKERRVGEDFWDLGMCFSRRIEEGRLWSVLLLRRNAARFLVDDLYRNSGPLQFEGDGSDSKTFTLSVEDQDYMGRIKLLQEYLDKVKDMVKPGCSQEVLKAALSAMASVTDVLSVMSYSNFQGLQ